MSNAELLMPGCQAKGLLALPANAAAIGQSGTLTTGAYRYVVTAVINGVETPACSAQTTRVTNTNNQLNQNMVLLQWNGYQGATTYNVYRSQFNGQTFTPYQLLTFTAAGPNCPATQPGQRCNAQDRGSNTTPTTPLAQPQFVAAWDAKERHPDVRFTQCIDYGGTALTSCPNAAPTTGDDPFTVSGTGEAAEALKTDVLHFPPGFTPNPSSAPACKLADAGGPSLIGDPNKFGSDDPFEDTCPAASKVGSAQTLSMTQNGLSITQGDIYVGETKGNEPGRLFIVLRPACSAGTPSPFNPGGPTCNGALGGAGRQVEKEFLASASSFVQRADGSYGIDARTVRAENDGDLEPYLNVLAPTPNGLVRAAHTPVQVRQLTQHLFGYADKTTADTSDDAPFINLPSSCGDKSIGADKTVWNDNNIASAAAGFNMAQSYCDALPFAPKLSGVVSGETQEGGFPTLDITVTQNADEAASKVVKVTLPSSLGTNLAGLQNTCTQDQLNADQCPANSVVGSAKASSPLLPGELSGPAYLLAQPGGLPKLVVRLKGLITLDLVGTIDISGGSRIVNLFSNVPDVVLSSFTLHVNGGSAGLLKNVTDLCNGVGNADGEFTSHGGKVYTTSAPLGLATPCTFSPNAIGTSARAKVRIVLAKVKSGRPTLVARATRGRANYASKIAYMRVIMPRGLKIRRGPGLESRLKVKAGSNLLPLTQLVVRTGLITVTNISGGPVDKVTDTFSRKSLRSFGSLRRLGRRARPVFRVRVRTFGKKTYSYKIKVKPRS